MKNTAQLALLSFCASLPIISHGKEFTVTNLESVSVDLTRVKSVHVLKSRFGTELKLVEVFFEGQMPIANIYLMTANREEIQKIWEIPTSISSVSELKTEELPEDELSTQITIKGTKLKNSIGPIFRNTSITIIFKEDSHSYVVEGRTVTDKKLPWPSDQLHGTID